MVIKREFIEDGVEFCYDTSDNSVLEYFTGRECIDKTHTIYDMLFCNEETTVRDVFLEMSNQQQYCDCT